MKIRITLFCIFSILIIALLFNFEALSQEAEPTITEFKVQAMYRAAKLIWKAKGDPKNALTVQILRADTFEAGPYKEVGRVNIIPGKSAYEYIDKTMGAESKYYYKLIVKENNESFGPLPTRPYFSPPAT